MEDDRRESWGRYVAWAVLAALVVFAVWHQVTERYVIAGRDGAAAAAFGDAFGAVNALFTGLSLLGISAAIILQAHSLNLQRRDLKATLEEVKMQREAQEKSAEALQRQIEAMDRQTEVHGLSTAIGAHIDAAAGGLKYMFADDDRRKVFSARTDDLIKQMTRLREILGSYQSDSHNR